MIQFAKRVDKLKPASVYEIIKRADEADLTRAEGDKVVRLFVGNPGPETMPYADIAKISEGILSRGPVPSLTYGPTEGYPPLRAHLKKYLADKFNIGTDDDEIIITSGATQAIELVARAFSDEGDKVITENPTFVGTLGSFNCYGKEIVGVDMETDGMDLDKLEKALAKHKDVKFIYVIPNFHNPTSWTMTLEKRKRLYELALKHGVALLEDDAYRDLRYTGDDIPTLKSMDTHGIVFYTGSFSKVISPGLRVGYIVMNKKFVDKLSAAKQVTDVHTTTLSQMIVHEFMTNYDYDQHILDIRDIYREKLAVTLKGLKEHLGDKIEYIVPDGGLYVYCKLPEHIDTMEFYQKGLEMGAVIVYASSFYVNQDAKSPYFRINFSAPSLKDLERGMKILGEVMKLFE